MSIPNSKASANSKAKSLAERAEERFFTLDHVGTVRHIEGFDLNAITPLAKRILRDHGAEFEDATEKVKGITVYTNIASSFGDEGFTVWLKASQFEGVGVLLDVKIFHSTEYSAAADEELSRFTAELEERVAELGPT